MKSQGLSILHISTTDNKGGSGRSAYRIHSGLRDIGVTSRMLVGQKVTKDPDVDSISKGLTKLLDRMCGEILKCFSLQSVFYPSSFYLIKHKWFKEADIVQLYNLHGNYFTHLALPLINKYKPIVWRLSDMWPMTGHCAYSYECEKWKSGCGNCPDLEEYPRLRKDKTAFLWKLKCWVTNKLQNMVIVAPSLWIKKNVEESPILRKFPVYHIPNGIDTNVFKEKDKKKAREFLGLDSHSKVILFISQDFNVDKRKGGRYLIEALSTIDKAIQKNIILLMVGGSDNENLNDFSFRVFKAGYITSHEFMVNLYSASDIMVLPTLAENLPNTIMESMACGTPVVAFDVGGVPEVITHMHNGYLAKVKDTKDLSNGIKLLLTESELLNDMKICGRKLIEERFTKDAEVRSFLNLYYHITGGSVNLVNKQTRPRISI